MKTPCLGIYKKKKKKYEKKVKKKSKKCIGVICVFSWMDVLMDGWLDGAWIDEGWIVNPSMKDGLMDGWVDGLMEDALM